MVLGATVAGLLSAMFSSSSSLESSSKYELASSTVATRNGATAVTNDATGWKSLNVFYGDRTHLTNGIPEEFWLQELGESHPATGKWFSQHGQDVAVQQVLNFKQGGFFVDLAANDAVWASNTFILESNFNWKGICIEAVSIFESAAKISSTACTISVTVSCLVSVFEMIFPSVSASYGLLE
jgi:hypothetical protein